MARRTGTPRTTWTTGILALVVIWLLAAGAAAQEASEPDVPPQPPEAENAEPVPDRATPRGAVLGYLLAARKGDFEDAATYLDLSPVPSKDRAKRGPRLARQLKQVLDRTLWVDLQSLSNEPEGNTDDGLPKRRDRVGVIESAKGPVDVYVDRGRRPDGAWVWEFSSVTVDRIPDLNEEFGFGRLGRVLPSVFFESQFLEIQLWQWLGLMGIVIAAYMLSWVVVRMILRAASPFVERSKSEIDDQLLSVIGGPLRAALALVLFTVSLFGLGLALPAEQFFGSLEKALGVIVATWLVLRVVDIFGSLLERRLERGGRDSAIPLVPLGRKTLKFVIAGLALLAALDSFGFDVTALIAGLGVGGLAFALAAQKTIENLFGGATLLADRPVRVGDFCRFGDQVGVVEEIGMRSTRIRTLNRTLITVPNADFSSLQLENFAARDKILYKPKLGLRYETTPDQLRWVLVEIRRMLYAHPKVDPDPARVRFTGFGDFSLDLEIWAYVLATDFSEYLEIAEDLNLRIMDIVDESGSGFAFPSSTTYLAKDDGPTDARAREISERVAAWRSEGTLYLPGFPPEKIEELDDTLDYPPKGSALRDET
jgi:MscS family membrane protein